MPCASMVASTSPRETAVPRSTRTPATVPGTCALTITVVAGSRLPEIRIAEPTVWLCAIAMSCGLMTMAFVVAESAALAAGCFPFPQAAPRASAAIIYEDRKDMLAGREGDTDRARERGVGDLEI